MNDRPLIPVYPRHLSDDERLAVLNLSQERHAVWMLDEANKGAGSDGRNLPAPMELVVELHAREVVQGRWRDERIAALEKQVAELLAKTSAGKGKRKP